MPRKMTTRQKADRTLQSVDPSDGRLGKRPVKERRVSDKQIKGDRTKRPDQSR